MLKLGSLLLKCLHKSVADKIKQQAAIHPRIRQLIIGIAQKKHQITIKMKRRIYGRATDVEIRRLNKERAVEAAVDLIGEVSVNSAARHARQKVDAARQKVDAMRKKVDDLEEEKELLKHRLEEPEQLDREKELFKHRLKEQEQLARGRGLKEGNILEPRESPIIHHTSGPTWGEWGEWED